MKLSISNIAWENEIDEEMYKIISQEGFDAIEIAPTRIFSEKPYDKLEQAKQFKQELFKKYHLNISSMQSIWYGRTEKIFQSQKERKDLIEYTKKAIDFASIIQCNNLVFGCPKNRVIQSEEDFKIAIEFFKEIGEYAKQKNTVFALEPNPPIYNTNFINTTKEAIQMVEDVNCEAIKVNLDLGTMIENKEDLDIIENHYHQINHIHISEPNLEKIEERKLHKELAQKLKQNNYNNYISIEMKKGCSITKLKQIMEYVKGVF